MKKLATSIINRLNTGDFASYIFELLAQRARSMDPKESLIMLFGLDQRLYELQSQEAARYGNGVHPKHKHIKYHNFFTSHINSGESVLDVGSSTGELINDIAKAAAPGKVVGIELEKLNYEKAIAKVRRPNLTFVHGDVTKDLPDSKFDVVTLSNVLEHIEHRPQLLKKIIAKYHPTKVLIRVPLFERDWRVPLKKEIGIDYKLDVTHFIEFTQETFASEMKKAGLKIDEMQIRWGEIWAVLSPKS